MGLLCYNKINMKFFTILIIVLAIFSTIFVGIFFALQYISKQPNPPTEPEVKVEEKEVPKKEEVVIEMQKVYGIEIQKKCVSKLEEFIKNYGVDYSKCLSDFNFDEQYCGGINPDTQGLSNVNVVVILDSSGSMSEKIDGQSKSDVAKWAISNFLTKMPQGVNTSLVVYGHKGSNLYSEKDLSCRGVEEVVKLGNNNYNNIISAMNGFSPKGWTPIAGSIDFAKNIFQKNGTGNKNYLVLLSDGAESCDGDPVLTAEDFKIQVPGTKFIVIGFATDAGTESTLSNIAKYGGGTYLDADDSSDIAKIFNEQLLVIKKDCLKMTMFKLSSGNSTNNLNNTKCWLDLQQKETKLFTENIVEKSFGSICNLEISKALQSRQNDFWLKKQAIEEANAKKYKKIEADFNAQLKILNDTRF